MGWFSKKSAPEGEPPKPRPSNPDIEPVLGGHPDYSALPGGKRVLTNKKGEALDPRTPLLTQRRIIDTLRSMDLNFFWDDDGDIRLDIGNQRFLLGVQDGGALLFMRATWEVELPIFVRRELLNLTHDFNTRTFWPKTFVTVDDDGDVYARAENTIPLPFGVSDQQLNSFLDCFLTTSMEFLRMLEDKYPDIRFGTDPMLGDAK